ncbi:MAG: acyloxyacyl hydrolase [Flavobacteriales bacterium]|nr:acyloxyacyl hydrolase [Flavobacteriales bacterium]
MLPYRTCRSRTVPAAILGMRLGWGAGPGDATVRPKGEQQADRDRLSDQHRDPADVGLTATASAVREISAGFGIDHWSNGSFALPNLGLNLLSASLGVAQALGPVTPYVHVKDTVPLERPRREQSVVGSLFWARLDDRRTASTACTARSGRAVARDAQVGSGLRGVTSSTRGAAQRAGIPCGQRAVGAHAGRAPCRLRTDLRAWRACSCRWGVRTRLCRTRAAVFHRMGCRHRIGRHLIAYMALKSHHAVAITGNSDSVTDGHEPSVSPVVAVARLL